MKDSKFEDVKLQEFSENNHKGEDENQIKSQPKIKEKGIRRYIGFIFALLGAILTCVSNLSSKILIQRKYHPFNILFWRYQGITTIVPLIIVYLKLAKNKNVFDGLWQDKKTIFFLVLRGIVGFWGFCLFVYSMQYVSMADSTVISFSTPIAVTFLAWITLGEPCGIVPIILAFVTFSGVIVLSRPPLLTGAEAFDDQNMIGISMSFAGMLTLTGVFVILRYLRKVHFLLPILFSGYVASIQCLGTSFALGVVEVPRNSEDWLITTGASLMSLCGQICMTLSLRYEEAGPVSLVRTSDIVFAFILQLIFLGVVPDVFSIVGAIIIIVGIFFTTFRKWLTTLPDDDSSKVKYWFILK